MNGFPVHDPDGPHRLRALENIGSRVKADGRRRAMTGLHGHDVLRSGFERVVCGTTTDPWLRRTWLLASQLFAAVSAQVDQGVGRPSGHQDLQC